MCSEFKLEKIHIVTCLAEKLTELDVNRSFDLSARLKI